MVRKYMFCPQHWEIKKVKWLSSQLKSYQSLPDRKIRFYRNMPVFTETLSKYQAEVFHLNFFKFPE